MVDISTSHLTSEDRHILRTRDIPEAMVVRSVDHDWYIIPVFIESDLITQYRADMDDLGFSGAFHDILHMARSQGFQYIRFNIEGPEYSFLPEFQEIEDSLHSSNLQTGDVVLMLDVDGVLNRCGDSNQGLESDKVELLRRAVEELNRHVSVALVITSSWRENTDQLRRLIGTFTPMGFSRISGTPILGLESGRRAAEIREWMYLNRCDASNIVIIDDDPEDMGGLEHRRIKTDSLVGLTREHITALLSMALSH